MSWGRPGGRSEIRGTKRETRNRTVPVMAHVWPLLAFVVAHADGEGQRLFQPWGNIRRGHPRRLSPRERVRRLPSRWVWCPTPNPLPRLPSGLCGAVLDEQPSMVPLERGW